MDTIAFNYACHLVRNYANAQTIAVSGKVGDDVSELQRHAEPFQNLLLESIAWLKRVATKL